MVEIVELAHQLQAAVDQAGVLARVAVEHRPARELEIVFQGFADIDNIGLDLGRRHRLVAHLDQ